VQGEGRSHVIIEQSNFNDILNTVWFSFHNKPDDNSLKTLNG
jgi:hypothetical protein